MLLLFFGLPAEGGEGGVGGGAIAFAHQGRARMHVGSSRVLT